MKITSDNIGQHGKVVNGESVLYGEVIYAYGSAFGFQIDGSYQMNAFAIREWDFTPDASELPTTPGWYLIYDNAYNLDEYNTWWITVFDDVPEQDIADLIAKHGYHRMTVED